MPKFQRSPPLLIDYIKKGLTYEISLKMALKTKLITKKSYPHDKSKKRGQNDLTD